MFLRSLLLFSSCRSPAASPSLRFLSTATSIGTSTAAYTNSHSTLEMKPRPPYQYRLPDAPASLLDLTELAATISLSEGLRQEAYESSRNVQADLVRARAAVESGTSGGVGEAALASLTNALATSDAVAHRTPRLANLSNRVEDYVRLCAYQHFLETGKLMKLPAGVTDEEYLGGACMGLATDLGRYGLGRATARDVESVQIAANLTGQILEFLLQLDFRNGPLRRKYDGTKYSLKSLETLLYELTITGGGAAASGSVDGDNGTGDAVMKQEEGEEQDVQPPANKRAKTLQLLPMDDLEALQLRMVHRDELREALIKKSRDGQKAAKQSIFALHRGDPEKALQLLQQCHECILQQLLPIVQEEPPLRNGCFANVLEEYVEAKMFMTWLYGKDSTSAASTGSSSPSIDTASGIVLLPTDFDIALEPEEYLGGLCDLTGEVGRYAVQRGTARDVRGVQLCLQTNSDIYTALQSLERLPGGNGMGKKLDAVRQSVWKLERMLYEMSLSEAAGGRNVQTSSMETAEEKGESQD
jgi:predicted translin family RNA/ssDNA-binding protein